MLKRPRWILAVALGLLIVFVFAQLGMWQLSRLEERRVSNALVTSRMHEQPRTLSGLLGQYGPDPESLVFRRAIVEGTYVGEDEFYSVGRTYDDLTGTMLLTPLELVDGSIMIVVRGLAPLDVPGPPAVGYEPPTGPVTLVGQIDDGEEPSGIGEPDPESGVLRSLSRVDLDYINTWMDGDVLPISLILADQSPANQGLTPAPIPADELTEGRHLGYAVQWFAFAVIVAIGVAALVWKAGTSAEDNSDPL